MVSQSEGLQAGRPRKRWAAGRVLAVALAIGVALAAAGVRPHWQPTKSGGGSGVTAQSPERPASDQARGTRLAAGPSATIENGEFSDLYLQEAARWGTPMTLGEARAAAAASRFPLRLPDSAVVPEAKSVKLTVALERGGYAVYFAQGLHLTIRPSELPAGSDVQARLGMTWADGSPAYRKVQVGKFVAAGREARNYYVERDGETYAPAALVWEEPSGQADTTLFFSLIGQRQSLDYLLKVAASLE